MSGRLTPIALVVVLAALLCGQAHAQEQDNGNASNQDDPYFALKLMLGLAGSASAGNVSVGGTTFNASGSTDLHPTFGGGFEYMHPLHRYFVLGGLFGIHSWQTSGGGSRNLMLDLSLVPQGRFPVTPDVELFLGLPVGLTLDFLNNASASAAGVNVSAGTGVGFNLALLFGARFALSKSVGLLAEIGYTLHDFSHTIKVQTPIAGISASASADYTLEQLALNAGVYF